MHHSIYYIYYTVALNLDDRKLYNRQNFMPNTISQQNDYFQCCIILPEVVLDSLLLKEKFLEKRVKFY